MTKVIINMGDILKNITFMEKLNSEKEVHIFKLRLLRYKCILTFITFNLCRTLKKHVAGTSN